MKNNKLAKFMALVLLVTLLAIILVSGTYAKYTTTVSASDTATVAKWNIMLDQEDISNGTTKTLTLGLFDTILDSDADEGNPETNVSKVDSKKLIAPGTSGSFNIANLKNESQVDAEYKITYTVENTSSIPLKFSTNKNAADEEWTEDLNTLSMKNFAELKNGTPASTGTIYWKWAFDGNDDSKDTELGIAAPTVTVTATITVQQVD